MKIKHEINYHLVSVAITHGIRHNQLDMKYAIQKVRRIVQSLLKVKTVFMIADVSGLISPRFLGWYTWIMPLSAAVLAGLMLCSIFFHQKYHQNPAIFVDDTLLILAVFLAYRLWALSPL